MTIAALEMNRSAIVAIRSAALHRRSPKYFSQTRTLASTRFGGNDLDQQQKRNGLLRAIDV
jgi:hypothetical protein